MSSTLRRTARFILAPVINACNKLRARKALAVLEKTQSQTRRPGPIRVVFLVQYLPAWNKISSVYEAMRDSDDFEPTILCVPPNPPAQPSALDASQNPTYAYFLSQDYDARNALDAEGAWVDVRSLDPDYVFHDRPYNHFMPQPYKSGQIAPYARLGSIMYGSSWTDNYVDVAFNTDYFKDVSYYFAEDQTNAAVFEKQFKMGVKRGLQEAVFTGSPVLESIVTHARNEKSAWEGLDGAPRVLWTPRWSTDKVIGGSHFLDYKDWFISYASEHLSWAFVLRPHPLMFDNFVNTGEMSEDEVAVFRRSCEELPNVTLDESPDYLGTLSQSDVLLMDTSSIVLEAFLTGKPIIYCPHDAAGVLPEYLPMAKTLYEARSTEDIESLLVALQDEDAQARAQREETIASMSARLAAGATDRILRSLKSAALPDSERA